MKKKLRTTYKLSDLDDSSSNSKDSSIKKKMNSKRKE